ncbi:copper exporting ATPase [uncultured Clostridium sp.]|nr:copper exporting ATPase [uncultured Clostridium sp.]
MDGMGSTILICIVLAVICVFSVRGYIKKLKNGCCGAGGDEVRRIRPVDREIAHYPYTYRLKIDGMSCKNCAIRIENAFNEQNGFYAKVDLGKKSAIIRMKAPAPEQILEQTVSRAGYRVMELEQLTP